MGGEIFLPVTESRIGMNVALGPRPDDSTTDMSTSWIGAGSHSCTNDSATAAVFTRWRSSGGSSGGGGSVHKYSSSAFASPSVRMRVLRAGAARLIVASSSSGRDDL